MKAILVFDVDEFTYEAINDYFTGVIDLHLGNDKFIDFEDVILQPMPQKLNATEIAIEIEKFKVDDKLMYQVEGWNRCIDEILGDTEDE